MEMKKKNNLEMGILYMGIIIYIFVNFHILDWKHN